jgi:hypothetical protein
MQQVESAPALLMIAARPAKGTPPPAVYNPGTGSAPQALVTQAHLLLDILGWAATSACVGGILIVVVMMAVSHHRGTGSEHFAGLGKILAACVLVGTAGPIVQFLV